MNRNLPSNILSWAKSLGYSFSSPNAERDFLAEMAEFNREGYGTLFQHLLDHIAPEETVHTAHAQIRLNMLESELRSIDTDVSSLQTPTLLEEGQALEAQIRATNNELELVQTEILKQEEELSTIQRISSEIRQRRLLLIGSNGKIARLVDDLTNKVTSLQNEYAIHKTLQNSQDLPLDETEKAISEIQTSHQDYRSLPTALTSSKSHVITSLISLIYTSIESLNNITGQYLKEKKTRMEVVEDAIHQEQENHLSFFVRVNSLQDEIDAMKTSIFGSSFPDVPSDRMAQTDWTNLSSDQASLRTIQLVCECDAAVSAYASSEMALLVDTIDKGMTILDQLEDVEAAIEVNAREDSESEQTMRETIKASSILAATVENTAQKLAQKLSHLNDHTIPTLQTSTKDERLDTFVGQLFLLSNEEDQTRIVPLPTNASDESTVETFLDTSSLLTELKEKLSRQRTQLSECARGFEEQPTIHEENIHKLVNRVRSGDEMLLTQWTPQVLSVCNSALQTADAFDKLTQTVDVWWKQPAQFALKDPVVDNLPLNDWIQKWKYLSHLLLSSQPQQNG